MKKILLTIIVLMFLFFGKAFAQTIDIEPEYCKVVSSDSNSTECFYIIDDSLLTDETQEYKLTTEQLYGNIENLIIANASDDFDYWFATLTGQDEKSGQAFIYRKNKAFSDKPDWNQVQTFRNTLDEPSVYFTLRNNSLIATGIVGTVKATFGKKRQ